MSTLLRLIIPVATVVLALAVTKNRWRPRSRRRPAQVVRHPGFRP